MRELKRRYDRDWFARNKQPYDVAVRGPALPFIGSLGVVVAMVEDAGLVLAGNWDGTSGEGTHVHAVNQSQLPFVGMSHEFVGKDQGGVGVSFFLVVGQPGQGTRLHKHDYDEIVYVIEGQSKWTVSGQERQARAGDVLVVRAGEPHKFVNSGDGQLRQIDIHLNPTFETVWLEE